MNKRGISHKQFIEIKKMPLNKNASENETLTVFYSFGDSPFGDVLIGSTNEGLCFLALIDKRKKALEMLKSYYSSAIFLEQNVELHQQALTLLCGDWTQMPSIKLCLKGTPFQHKVWQKLLDIPFGECVTYRDIAMKVGNPKACRAVGSAMGSNPIAYLIPCHRVIRTGGGLGGFRWGLDKKQLILNYENSNL